MGIAAIPVDPGSVPMRNDTFPVGSAARVKGSEVKSMECEAIPKGTAVFPMEPGCISMGSGTMSKEPDAMPMSPNKMSKGIVGIPTGAGMVPKK